MCAGCSRFSSDADNLVRKWAKDIKRWTIKENMQKCKWAYEKMFNIISHWGKQHILISTANALARIWSHNYSLAAGNEANRENQFNIFFFFKRRHEAIVKLSNPASGSLSWINRTMCKKPIVRDYNIVVPNSGEACRQPSCPSAGEPWHGWRHPHHRTRLSNEKRWPVGTGDSLESPDSRARRKQLWDVTHLQEVTKE